MLASTAAVDQCFLNQTNVHVIDFKKFLSKPLPKFFRFGFRSITSINNNNNDDDINNNNNDDINNNNSNIIINNINNNDKMKRKTPMRNFFVALFLSCGGQVTL